ncbi:Trehalose 6-phosphate synthase [Gracilaria domingensis]|nr:Trehalose 6-phosphate synthase [Gracilaria domingensis]
MFSRFISQMSDWTKKTPPPETPSSPSSNPSSSSNPINTMRSKTPRSAPTHSRQKSGNFSEVDFMDSGLGRSLTADLPVLGLQDELDALQYDDHFVEEYLLSRLQDAQRRLQEVRDYMATLAEEELVSARRPPLPHGSPNSIPRPAAPKLNTKRSRRSEKLFVASFRLPLTVEVTDDGEVKSSISSGSLGLVSAFTDLLGRLPIRWLGTPAQTYQDVTQMPSSQRQKMERHFNTRHRRAAGLLSYVPLFPDVNDALAHQEFCNAVMWPLFHYIPLNYAGEKMYQVDMYDAYERINRFYADALIEEWKRSGIDESQAMFWIHDFHLFLVPKFLRDRLPNARIGFSLHTPFPAGEVFRALAPRKELLEGLLGADLIGFHTYDYARHFLSVCERLLGLTSKPDAVDNKGVFVQVGIYPFGIDANTFRTAMKQTKS